MESSQWVLIMSDAIINLGVSLEQKALIDYAARLVHANGSDFVLEAACERAKSTILDQTVFNLNAQDFDGFLKILNVRLHQKFQRLLAVKAPWTIVSE